jgi:hypothetical protein
MCIDVMWTKLGHYDSIFRGASPNLLNFGLAPSSFDRKEKKEKLQRTMRQRQ